MTLGTGEARGRWWVSFPARAGVALVWALAVGYFAWIQFSSDRLACTDVFFHLRFAKLLGEHGFIRDFPWMQFTIFRDHWVDQHFLFHVLLVPFTRFGHLFTGGKIAASLLAGTASTMFFVFLRRQRVPHAFLWLLLLLGSSYPFLYRMNMVRGQSLGLLLFLIYLDALFRGRARTAFLAAFVFVWAYQLFLLLVPFTLVVAWASRREAPAGRGRVAAWGLGGLLAGIVINPFFPRNVVFLYQHAVVKVLNRAELGVGGEWSPFSSWFVLTGSLPVYVALGVTALLLLTQGRKVRGTTLGAVGVATVVYVLHMHSRRFVEYWPPFALLAAALVFRDVAPWESWRARRLYRPMLLALGVLLGGLMLGNFRLAVRDLDANLPSDRYEGGAHWLAAHAAPGEIIYTTDWDDFPELFFYNPQHYYLVGLDPTFMLLYDRTLFYEWDQLSNGRLPRPSALVRRDFRSRFVFTDLAHRDFLKVADEDPGLQRVFLDANCAIYEVAAEETPGYLRLEAEARFPPERTGGSVCRIQDLTKEFGVACSNARILLYRAAGAGDFFELELLAPDPGRYEVGVWFVRAPDYGRVQVRLDGERLGDPFDGFDPRIGVSERVTLGEVDLSAGRHRLRFEVTGRHPESMGYFVGLDLLELTPAKISGVAPPAPQRQ